MKILKWIGIVIVGLIAIVLFLDTFGGKFLDGPIGPIRGGAFVGSVNPETNPDWSQIGQEIQIEIRPEEPWSLTVWAVEHEGALYIPHASGRLRRWVPVAMADPRIRVRTGGQIYEQMLERLPDDAAVRPVVLQKIAKKYGFDTDGGDDGSVWLFKVTPR